MELHCLACDALARIVYLCAAQSPHIVNVDLLKLGLHCDPDDLRSQLQNRIDAVSSEEYNAIVMAYGLCGKATAGLQAKTLPIIIPRAHDCITLFLGSRGRYQEQFEQHSGTYWYSKDYIERADGSGTALSLGSDMGINIHDVYDEYVEKYGKDNADYLMEVLGAWQDHYQRAAFIDMGVGDSSNVEEHAKEEASRRGWTFERVSGDLILIRRLLNGDWDNDFLILKPGETLTMSYDEDVITAKIG
ncbi:MAG: DUF1638 domain-containing protein [bacterium]|nr:DUF1638 domain-containing protein [bacterium]